MMRNILVSISVSICKLAKQVLVWFVGSVRKFEKNSLENISEQIVSWFDSRWKRQTDLIMKRKFQVKTQEALDSLSEIAEETLKIDLSEDLKYYNPKYGIRIYGSSIYQLNKFQTEERDRNKNPNPEIFSWFEHDRTDYLVDDDQEDRFVLNENGQNQREEILQSCFVNGLWTIHDISDFILDRKSTRLNSSHRL